MRPCKPVDSIRLATFTVSPQRSHKGFSPLFSKSTPEIYKPIAKDHLLQRLEWVDAQLQNYPFLMGESYTVADIYLFNVTNWARLVGLKLNVFANLIALRARFGRTAFGARSHSG